jgi:hypothetical protein
MRYQLRLVAIRICHINGRERNDMLKEVKEWIKRWWFDHKEGSITVTGFFDGWSFIHLATWVAVAHVVELIHSNPWWFCIMYGLVGSYIWEIIEYPLQRHYPKRWSNRRESLPNSFISDPICNMTGLIIGVWIVKHYHYLATLMR